MSKKGISMVEILVASLIMAAVMVPLLSLFQSGVETTKSTISEVSGANLAAEISEQMDTIPFDSLMNVCATENTVFSTDNDTLKDGAPIDPQKGFFFHLSPLPQGFTREVELGIIDEGKVLILTRVSWPVNKKRMRTISINRIVSRNEVGVW